MYFYFGLVVGKFMALLNKSLEKSVKLIEPDFLLK